MSLERVIDRMIEFAAAFCIFGVMLILTCSLTSEVYTIAHRMLIGMVH